MRYYGDVYRPPSEAYSLIVQITYGCSHNTCAFCTMYKAKKFTIRPMDEILEDLREAAFSYGKNVNRIFLADGDALIRKTDDLVIILDEINKLFPNKERVTSYASPASLLLKSVDELKLLKEKGLEMVYLGLESGSDEVLKLVNKGYSSEQIITAGCKAREAGMQLSVTAVSGLGSHELSKEHALKTAEAFSKMNPEYIGLLTLEVVPGTPMYDWVKKGTFKLLDPIEVLKETGMMVENIDSDGSVFRANHASNYLPLKGTFNRDRDDILEQIRLAIDGQIRLRPEWSRSL